MIITEIIINYIVIVRMVMSTMVHGTLSGSTLFFGFVIRIFIRYFAQTMHCLKKTLGIILQEYNLI